MLWISSGTEECVTQWEKPANEEEAETRDTLQRLIYCQGSLQRQIVSDPWLRIFFSSGYNTWLNIFCVTFHRVWQNQNCQELGSTHFLLLFILSEHRVDPMKMLAIQDRYFQQRQLWHSWGSVFVKLKENMLL